MIKARDSQSLRWHFNPGGVSFSGVAFNRAFYPLSGAMLNWTNLTQTNAPESGRLRVYR